MIFLSLSSLDFFQKHFGTDGIKDAAFTAFSHDLCCFLRRQSAELHIFNHLSNKVEGDHAVSAHRIKFQNFSLWQAILRPPKPDRMLNAMPLNPRVTTALLNLPEQSADVDADSQIGSDQLLNHFPQGIQICEDSRCSRTVLLVRN